MVAITSNLEILPTTYREFYVYYLAKHRQVWTKRMHLLGTAVAVIGAIIAALRGRLAGVLLSGITGLAICWAGDVIVEETQPTTFKYPFWSIEANFKMLKGMMRNEGFDC